MKELLHFEENNKIEYLTEEKSVEGEKGFRKAAEIRNKVDYKMASLVKPAMDAPLTIRTRKRKKSHIHYWKKFCTKYGVDQSLFGKRIDLGEDISEIVRN